jgi:hypothetical protein
MLEQVIENQDIAVTSEKRKIDALTKQDKLNSDKDGSDKEGSDKEGSDSEDSEIEMQRSIKFKKARPKKTSVQKIDFTKYLVPDDIEEAFGSNGVHFSNFIDEYKTCFERLYIKQATKKSQNTIMAMRLKKHKHREEDSLFDPMECLMSRSNMNDPIDGLVLYSLSGCKNEEEWIPEADCEQDEKEFLLEQNTYGLEVWVGPNAIKWKGFHMKKNIETKTETKKRAKIGNVEKSEIVLQATERSLEKLHWDFIESATNVYGMKPHRRDSGNNITHLFPKEILSNEIATYVALHIDTFRQPNGYIHFCYQMTEMKDKSIQIEFHFCR